MLEDNCGHYNCYKMILTAPGYRFLKILFALEVLKKNYKEMMEISIHYTEITFKKQESLWFDP